LSQTELDQAAREREEGIILADIDRTLDLLLANYQSVTANPRSMGYLRFLLKHYAKSAHPWKDCFKDNFKRFGPKTSALCGVLKDTIRQGTNWRGHPGLDHGAPGVGIGEADASAAHRLSQDGCDLDRAFMAEFPDETEIPGEVFDIILKLAASCNVANVLLGLEQPPTVEVMA
jgi:hypothetical protein